MGGISKPESKRQKAFAALDSMAGLTRKEATVKLVKLLNVTTTYAVTLIQSHRKDRSKDSNDNGFVTIYKVRDTRSNTSVNPYMSSMIKNTPSMDDARTKQDAIIQYTKHNIVKNKLANKLYSINELANKLHSIAE